MKTAELLRKLADVIDSNSAEHKPMNSVNHATLQPVEVDNTEGGEASTMVPPLQQKLEILKKSAGMDNHFDDEEAAEEECACDQSDELDLIKQRAGISPAVVTLVTDDNDIVG